MRTAVTAVAKTSGGLAAASGEQTLSTLALPVAGLMSDRPMAEVRDAYAALLAAAWELGSPLYDPFMAMSFMALEVIPSLKLTDRGLVDVDGFSAGRSLPVNSSNRYKLAIELNDRWPSESQPLWQQIHR